MKLFVTLLSVLVSVVACPGQGCLIFANYSYAETHIVTNSVHDGPAAGPISGPRGSYYFALFVSPVDSVTSVTPNLAGWRLSQPPNGALGTNTASPGRFNGNEELGCTRVQGYFIGRQADFLVVGWSANIGTTWQQAEAWWNNGDPANGSHSAMFGWFGISTIARGVTLGSGAVPVPPLFGGGPNQMLGFTLNLHEVPEPSSAVLALLGGVLFWGKVRASQSRSERKPKSRPRLAAGTSRS